MPQDRMKHGSISNLCSGNFHQPGRVPTEERIIYDVLNIHEGGFNFPALISLILTPEIIS
jgi:hypothetical protein